MDDTRKLSEIVDQAACLMDKKGYCRGALADRETGEMCMLGALQASETRSVDYEMINAYGGKGRYGRENSKQAYRWNKRLAEALGPAMMQALLSTGGYPEVSTIDAYNDGVVSNLGHPDTWKPTAVAKLKEIAQALRDRGL